MTTRGKILGESGEYINMVEGVGAGAPCGNNGHILRL